jgi:hypothetical protein
MGLLDETSTVGNSSEKGMAKVIERTLNTRSPTPFPHRRLSGSSVEFIVGMINC